MGVDSLSTTSWSSVYVGLWLTSFRCLHGIWLAWGIWMSAQERSESWAKGCVVGAALTILSWCLQLDENRESLFRFFSEAIKFRHQHSSLGRDRFMTDVGNFCPSTAHECRSVNLTGVYAHCFYAETCACAWNSTQWWLSILFSQNKSRTHPNCLFVDIVMVWHRFVWICHACRKTSLGTKTTGITATAGFWLSREFLVTWILWKFKWNTLPLSHFILPISPKFVVFEKQFTHVLSWIWLIGWMKIMGYFNQSCL